VKLSGLVAGIGVIGAPRFTPDGQFVVYTAYALDAGKRQLYSVPLAGGANHRISAGTSQEVTTFLISPDGQWVGYMDTDAPPTCFQSMHGAPVRGENQSVKLGSAVHCDLGSEAALAFSADSRWLLVAGFPFPGSQYTTYSAAIDGSSTLHHLSQHSADDIDYAAQPDRLFVANGDELVAHAPDASIQVPLSSALAGRARFLDYSPQANRVLMATISIGGRNDLHTIAPDGSPAPVQLTDAGVWSNGLCPLGDLALAMDGQALFFCDAQAQAFAFGTVHTSRLAWQPLSGGELVVLDSAEYTEDGPTLSFPTVLASPASATTVVYRSNKDTGDDRMGLYLATVAFGVFADGFE